MHKPTESSSKPFIPDEKLDPRRQAPGRYRHYKGNEYQVIDCVFHSETQELLVLYKPLYGDGALWVRPYAMFNEWVEVDGEKIARFQLIDE